MSFSRSDKLRETLDVERYITFAMPVKLSPEENRVLDAEMRRWKSELGRVYKVLTKNLCVFAGEMVAHVAGLAGREYLNFDVYYTGTKPLTLLDDTFSITDYGGGQVAEKFMTEAREDSKPTILQNSKTQTSSECQPSQTKLRIFRYGNVVGPSRVPAPRIYMVNHPPDKRIPDSEIDLFEDSDDYVVEPVSLFLAADSYENVFYKRAIDPTTRTMMSICWGTGKSYDPRMDRNLLVALSDENPIPEPFKDLRRTLTGKQIVQLMDYWTLVYRYGPWEAFARHVPFLSRKELLLRGLFSDTESLFAALARRFEVLYCHLANTYTADESENGKSNNIPRKFKFEYPRELSLPPVDGWFALAEHTSTRPLAEFEVDIIGGGSTAERMRRPPLAHLHPCTEHEACVRDGSFYSETFYCCGVPCSNLFKFVPSAELEEEICRSDQSFVFCLEGKWSDNSTCSSDDEFSTEEERSDEEPSSDSDSDVETRVKVFVECAPRFLLEKMALFSVLLEDQASAMCPGVEMSFCGRPCHGYRKPIGKKWTGSDRKAEFLRKFLNSTIDDCFQQCSCIYRDVK